MDTQWQNLSEIFNAFFEKRFLFWNPFFRKGFYFLGSILSQPVPVPGRDKIILKKSKAHGNRQEKLKKPKRRRTTNTERRQKPKSKKNEKRQEEKRTRTGKREIPKSPFIEN